MLTRKDANDANTAIVSDLFMYFPLDLCEDKNASADTDDDQNTNPCHLKNLFYFFSFFSFYPLLPCYFFLFFPDPFCVSLVAEFLGVPHPNLVSIRAISSICSSGSFASITAFAHSLC